MRNKESVFACASIAAIGIAGLAAPAEGKRHTKRHTKPAIEKQIDDTSAKRHTKRHT